MSRLLSYILFVLLMVSCIGEDRSNCMNEHFLQIYADESVHDLVVYIFDENQLFLDSVVVSAISAEAGSVSLTQIKLDYPGQSKVTAVVLGNLSNGNQVVTPLVAGITPITGTFLDLRTFEDVVLLARSPDDLFWGYLEINLSRGGGGAVVYHQMTLVRKVSSVQIITRGLHEFEGTTDSDFYYLIGTTYSSLSFQGIFSGAMVSYIPSSFFNANDDFVTPVFFTFPSVPAEAVHVYIYHAGELIFTISEDDEGNPLELDENKRLNVIIDLLGGRLSVTLDVQPWNTISIDQEFDGE